MSTKNSEMSARAPMLSNANLQAAQRASRSQLSHSQMAASSANGGDQLGNLPQTSSVMRQSKRNSVVSSQGGDHYSHSYYQPQVKYENTYRMGPNEHEKFNVSRVQHFVSDILSNHLENVKYEPNRCKDLSMKLSDEIKSRLKSIVFKRYKLIVNVTIGQNLGNSIVIASRSLWNTDTDNGCTVTYKNSTLHAIVTIFAAYCD